ncbi:MAG: peptidylprolyl isomerase [Pseudoxanthomonas suwonensis]|nr:peptidylprolyl isomerase [Pseudoxanthomonas suwonensis]
MLPRTTALAAALLLSACATAQTAPAADTPAFRSAGQIIAAAPEADWRNVDADNLLLMDVPGGRVMIELAPAFAPRHVENIRALARARWWDGLAIYRSQDNFVVQFGDPVADQADAKPLPTEVASRLPAEFERDGDGLRFDVLPDMDGWAGQVGFVDGFPAAREPGTGATWMAHCYGTLGAGRGNEADSSVGAELYVVTGQSPRQLDRNITVVGRVLKGMEYLSTVPRGPEPMGMHADPARHVPIHAIALASSLPASERPRLQVLRTDSQSFVDATEARRNRRDGWYLRPAGHIDLCNVPLPVREAP